MRTVQWVHLLALAGLPEVVTRLVRINAVDPTPLNIPSCSCFVPRSLGARAHNYAVYVCQHVYTCIRVANCRYTAFISCTTGKVVPIASRSREAASAARHLHTLQTHTIPPVRCQPPRYSKRVASEKNTHLVQSDLLEHATVRKSRCESTGRCTGCEFARGRGNAIFASNFCPPKSCISGLMRITP